MSQTKPSKKLRMALLGGGIGSLIGRVHWRAATLNNQAELVAGVFSSDQEKSASSAASYGLSSDRGFSNLKELIAYHKEEPIDFVAITTPNHLHVTQAIECIENGMHVVCDKPLSISLEEAQKLEETLKSSQSVFVLTHNYSGYPIIRHLRDMVRNGELGDILNVRARYIQGWLSTQLENSDHKQAKWRTDRKKSGPSGCFADIGTHAYQLARYVSGLQPEKISGQLKATLYNRELDDYGHALIQTKEGAWIDITASQVSQGYRNHFVIEIDGTKASASWLQESPEELIVRENGKADRRIYREQIETTSSLVSQSSAHPAGHPEGYLEAFANIYQGAFHAFHQANQGNDASVLLKDLPTIEDGVEGMRFVEATVESSQKEGAWVVL